MRVRQTAEAARGVTSRGRPARQLSGVQSATIDRRTASLPNNPHVSRETAPFRIGPTPPEPGDSKPRLCGNGPQLAGSIPLWHVPPFFASSSARTSQKWKPTRRSQFVTEDAEEHTKRSRAIPERTMPLASIFYVIVLFSPGFVLMWSGVLSILSHWLRFIFLPRWPRRSSSLPRLSCSNFSP